MKLRIVHGILLTFENMFCTFAPDPEVDKEECLKIYKMIKIMSHPGDIKFRPAFKGKFKVIYLFKQYSNKIILIFLLLFKPL